MSKNINEKMLEEMISDNFLEISKDGQEAINGGEKLGSVVGIVALYAIGPRPPKFSPVRALYSVGPSVLDLKKE